MVFDGQVPPFLPCLARGRSGGWCRRVLALCCQPVAGWSAAPGGGALRDPDTLLPATVLIPGRLLIIGGHGLWLEPQRLSLAPGLGADMM